MKITKPQGAAFLWDESFLWGLMAFKALKGQGLPFELIRAEDIKAGKLDRYKMLFVPGGWASNKSRALEETGLAVIRDFVAKGGSYLGFCGGAGLATKTKGGIGLLNVKRRPTKERVPSFSGEIELNLKSHPIWKTAGENHNQRTTDDGRRSTVFHAWWPSQLIVEDNDVEVLATYGNALSDSFSSDLNVGDVELNGDWAALENIYKINLDPERLLNEPSVIEGTYGKGKVVLSLVHFDTPDDLNGQQVLLNLWEYLANERSGARDQVREVRTPAPSPLTGEGWGGGESLSSDLYSLCTGLISLGERNFLWFRRNSMLFQWRRGVRGLEYNTLYIMMKEIAEIIGDGDEEQRAPRKASQRARQNMNGRLEKIKDLLVPFAGKAKRLLVLERHAMQRGHITYEKCDDTEIQEIRFELFSNSKSHGGLFKELLDEMDKLLFELINRN
ncbi:MAG: BPL-N domain-containing protein [Nitrospirota bacterium]